MIQAENIAYQSGYEEAKNNIPKSICPYYEEGLKYSWLNGWEWYWETEM